jgi:transposase
MEPGSRSGKIFALSSSACGSPKASPSSASPRYLSDLLGLEISEGALVNMLAAARDAFACQTSHFRARLMSGTILQSDETGLRVGKRNWWLVFHHDDSAVFVVEPSRGKKMVEDFFGDCRPDFWVSDLTAARWALRKRKTKFASLISFVTCNTLLTPARCFRARPAPFAQSHLPDRQAPG